MDTPTELPALAKERHGIVTRPALHASGWTDRRIAGAIGRGLLTRLAPGVYHLAAMPLDRVALWHAALAATPSGHLARRDAAALHGFGRAPVTAVDVSVPQGASCRTPAGDLVRIHSTRSLPAIDQRVVRGLRVTSPARTLLDLAARMGTRGLTELTAKALQQRACERADLDEVLARRRNARGRHRLREVLDVLGADGRAARAEVELVLLAELVAAGLPRPAIAHRVLGRDGRLVAELDLAYPDRRLAIEVDGFEWHSTPARKRADEVRQNALVLLGWSVLRFSAALVRTRPRTVVRTIAEALATR
jgi:predicted transcriptional regulator of viral defense system